ncbi:MAG: hypothetical protein AAF415_12855 [Pseudomonadota bacterium]
MGKHNDKDGAARSARLGAALRANLRRRKDQGRARMADKLPSVEADEPAEDGAETPPHGQREAE